MPLLRKSDLPDAQDLKDALPIVRSRDRLKPFLIGAGLLTAGAMLLRVKPEFGQVPDPRPYGRTANGRLRKGFAHRVRDGAATFAPSNLTDQLGKSLLMGGTAMLVARVLDEYLGPEEL
jgi:hypothetical protein